MKGPTIVSEPTTPNPSVIPRYQLSTLVLQVTGLIWFVSGINATFSVNIVLFLAAIVVFCAAGYCFLRFDSEVHKNAAFLRRPGSTYDALFAASARWQFAAKWLAVATLAMIFIAVVGDSLWLAIIGSLLSLAMMFAAMRSSLANTRFLNSGG